MHLLYFIKVQPIKNFFKKKKIFVITHRFESYRGTEFYRLQEADKGRKKFCGGSCKKKFLLQKTISSEVKAFVQSDVVVHKNFAGEYLDGKINL